MSGQWLHPKSHGIGAAPADRNGWATTPGPVVVNQAARERQVMGRRTARGIAGPTGGFGVAAGPVVSALVPRIVRNGLVGVTYLSGFCGTMFAQIANGRRNL